MLADTYKSFALSFEIFPPKTDAGVINLFNELDLLKKYKPAYISVTYGAGGSTQDRTIDLALEIKKRYEIDPLVHFTCVGASREDIRAHLEKVKMLGLTNILALRGDPPAGDTAFKAPENGFAYASELIAFIKEVNGFSIAAAGYPEKHPQAHSLDHDLDNLKRKVDAGAEIIITQLFFNNAEFLTFVNKAAQKGITVPIIPGIMPLTNAAQIEKMAQMCGARIPSALSDAITAAKDNDEIHTIGVKHAVRQCIELKKEGVKGFHFYPLNKAQAVSEIIEQCGLA